MSGKKYLTDLVNEYCKIAEELAESKFKLKDPKLLVLKRLRKQIDAKVELLNTSEEGVDKPERLLEININKVDTLLDKVESYERKFDSDNIVIDRLKSLRDVMKNSLTGFDIPSIALDFEQCFTEISLLKELGIIKVVVAYQKRTLGDSNHPMTCRILKGIGLLSKCGDSTIHKYLGLLEGPNKREPNVPKLNELLVQLKLPPL